MKERKTLAEATKELNKKFGDGTIVRIGRGNPVREVETIQTGIYSVDRILGGGFRRGGIVELYGNEGSGKTTLAMHAVALEQKKGHKCAYIDAEQSFTMEYAAKLGVNLEDLYFSQPDTAEQTFEVIRTLISTGEFSVIVLDSVAALMVTSVMDSEPGKSQIGMLARFLSVAIPQVLSDIQKTNSCLVCINQTRMAIGVMYGDPVTTPGGKALKFYASQRIQMDTSVAIKEGKDKVIGRMIRFKTLKNKIAIPFQKVIVPFMYGVGFDKTRDLFNCAVASGVIIKDKANYTLDGEKIAYGEANAYDAVKNGTDLQQKIVEKLDKIIGNITNIIAEDNE